jgi:putative DNA primase/helicase
MIAASDIVSARAVPIEAEIERRSIKLRRQGSELVGPCPRCGGVDRFSVSVRKQKFNCRVCGVGGGVIRLVQHLDRCEFKRAIATLAGGGPRTTPQPNPASPSVKKDIQSSVQTAAWLWSLREPITEGMPPWLHLRKRGYTMPIPVTLSYLPARNPHPAAMIAPFAMAAEPEPGMLAGPKPISGVHLTRLTAEGDKAPGAAGKTKIMLGVCKGSPVTISPANDLCGMAVTEGIEDGLSVYQVTGLGVWVAGAAAFMPALAALVPDYIETVTICGHADLAGRRGALDLARALKARGIEVLVQGL